MSEPPQTLLAHELHARIPSLLEQIVRLLVEVRILTVDINKLRSTELTEKCIFAGHSLESTESYLKKLQRGLLGDDEQEEDGDDD